MKTFLPNCIASCQPLIILKIKATSTKSATQSEAVRKEGEIKSEREGEK